MSDIEKILSKHFVGETSTEEEQFVQKFKLENPQEYDALKGFWTKKGAEVKEFDTSKAWQKIEQKANKTRPSATFRYLRVAASVAAVFLLVPLGFHFYNTDKPSVDVVKISAKTSTDKVELEDGSIVYLNNNASLSYPKKFDSNQRIVSLQGEAFFEIAKDAKRPFIIHTNHSDVEVLGTSFNINTETAQTEIAVATGKVKVKSLFNNKFSILTPNQSAKVDKEILEVFSTENKNYLAWKTGVFHFNKTPISQVVKELNTFYNNKVTLSKTDTDCLFSATLEQQKLDEILEIIKLTCDLQFNKKNKTYELY